MIKLLDILNELDQTSTSHWRDDLQKIIQCAEKALSSSDPDVISDEVKSIIDYAENAGYKSQITNSKQQASEFISSNIANSYSGDDSDINVYQNSQI